MNAHTRSINVRRIVQVASMLATACLINGCAHQPARGLASPWTGNPASDLASVHVHVEGGVLTSMCSLFDNGTLVNIEHGKLCQYAPATWLTKASVVHGGGQQIRQGNEIADIINLPYRFDFAWSRLPGPLVVRLYMSPSSGNSGYCSSAKINAVAGKTYYYNLTSDPALGGHTLRIALVREQQN